MNIQQSISTLEALASGFNPKSGKETPSPHQLTDQTVRSALQFAVEVLKSKTIDPLLVEGEVCAEDIETTLQSLKGCNLKPTAYRFRGFLWGCQKFKDTELEQHPLYGKYKTVFHKEELLTYFKAYFEQHQNTLIYDLEVEPWRVVDFFEKEKFNLLAISDVERLKREVAKMGINRIHNLSPQILKIRETHYRSHEGWFEHENTLLRRAMAHTNELSVLSLIFGRTENSIRLKGQQLIFQKELPTRLTIKGL